MQQGKRPTSGKQRQAEKFPLIVLGTDKHFWMKEEKQMAEADRLFKDFSNQVIQERLKSWVAGG